MDDLVLLDNVFGFSGYAKSTRELALAMSDKINLEIMNGQGYAPEKIYKYIENEIELEGKHVFTRPLFFKSVEFAEEKPKSIIGYVALEGFPVCERMVALLNDFRLTQIWVPSQYCRSGLLSSGVVDKINVVPHGVDSEKYAPRNLKKKYDFLFVGGYMGRGDRKGADLLVDAWKKADLDATLYLKINPAYSQNLHELEGKNIIVDDSVMTEDEIINLMNESKNFICPSYGEAFNMTLLEAMSCGLPCFSTLSGNEYFDVAKDFIIEYEKEVPAKFSKLDAQAMWKKPKIESIIDSLKLGINQDLGYAGKQNRNIAKKWSWKAASELAFSYIPQN
jgi:glycosyltransferase involved in cell wall biosynthesis